MEDTSWACKSIFQDIARFRGLLFDRLIAPHGLTMSQARVLLHLLADDALTQSELARRMDVGTVTVGGLVDRLEARGLVERRTDETDRRAKRVCLTEKARPLEGVMDACSTQVDGASFVGFGDPAVWRLLEDLQAVRGNLVLALNEDQQARPDDGGRAEKND